MKDTSEQHSDDAVRARYDEFEKERDGYPYCTAWDVWQAAYAAGLAARNEWLPIETAPKDGPSILIYDEHGVSIGEWLNGTYECNEGNWWIEGGQITASNPTHWMPLPLPPI